MRLFWGQLNDWPKPAQLASRGFSGTGCLLSVQTWSAVFWPHIESLLQLHCWWGEFPAFPAHRQWAHHISGPADAFCRSDHLRLSWDKVGTWRHRVCFQISPRAVTPSPSRPTVCPSNSLCPCCMSPLLSHWRQDPESGLIWVWGCINHVAGFWKHEALTSSLYACSGDTLWGQSPTFPRHLTLASCFPRRVLPPPAPEESSPCFSHTNLPIHPYPPTFVGGSHTPRTVHLP